MAQLLRSVLQHQNSCTIGLGCRSPREPLHSCCNSTMVTFVPGVLHLNIEIQDRPILNILFNIDLLCESLQFVLKP